MRERALWLDKLGVAPALLCSTMTSRKAHCSRPVYRSVLPVPYPMQYYEHSDSPCSTRASAWIGNMKHPRDAYLCVDTSRPPADYLPTVYAFLGVCREGST